MSPEIMGFQMDPNHLSCFVHNLSPCRIGYWKYPLVRSNPVTGMYSPEVKSWIRREFDESGFWPSTLPDTEFISFKLK
jgi:hypothetical protein